MENSVSQATAERATALKFKLSHFYTQILDECIQREQRQRDSDKKLESETWSEDKKRRQCLNIRQKESDFLRLRRTRMGVDDFVTIKVIGKGAFGQVRLVQKKDSGKIFAMKALKKSEAINNDQMAHVKAERDLLAQSTKTDWVVQLFYSFQDSFHLYLIMEFLPGGDLMSMLIKHNVFSEDVTRFYVAECVMAINFVHDLGYVHRDIKPDNLLIDRNGHLKLSDFGLSTGFHKTHDTTYYQRFRTQAAIPIEDSIKNIDLSLSTY